MLRGRVVVLTGVGPGMERAIALALAREGADLALGARSAARLDGEPVPGFDSGAAGRLWTAMLGVNAIPSVCEAAPGFLTAAELAPTSVLPPVL